MKRLTHLPGSLRSAATVVAVIAISFGLMMSTTSCGTTEHHYHDSSHHDHEGWCNECNVGHVDGHAYACRSCYQSVSDGNGACHRHQ